LIFVINHEQQSLEMTHWARKTSSVHQKWPEGQLLNTHSFIHSGYFYSASSSALLLRGAPDTAQVLHAEAPQANCEWRTCPRSLHGG